MMLVDLHFVDIITWLLAFSFVPLAAAAQNPVASVLSQAGLGGQNRYVFAHFIMGIVGNRANASDYDNDIKLAKSAGIDAFALNIGTEDSTDTQLSYAYASAASNNFKVFISFDFNFWSTSAAADVGAKVAKYASHPGQLRVDGKVFVSSFVGTGVDVEVVRTTSKTPIFFAPNFTPGGPGSFAGLDGAFNWVGWPNNGANRAPSAGANFSVADGDQAYISALRGKDYIAPVSPWFNTHYGAEVPYSKNWIFPSEGLYAQRWQEILTLGPRFVEIVTWNDYGESHYVGPLASPHVDDGNSKWTKNMPHGGWLQLAIPFIKAFHDSKPSPAISTDQLIYWYRPNPLSLDCDATDTTMLPADNSSGNYYNGKPNGWETVSDSVFVTTLLTSPADISVLSGSSAYHYSAPAGVSTFTVPMSVGKQQFALLRNNKIFQSAVSKRDVTNTCGCGNYNFNAYVGTVPEGPPDDLLPAGMAALTNGIRVPAYQCLNSGASDSSAAVRRKLRSPLAGWKDYVDF
ncbi:alpha-1,3-glucanase mutanase protein [Rutstroemia sp. NJR-2017a WRK4]|nr:alpha-1,3-glucanase mutanase protein [Rutstroemia sp. NJR-2017a WRK4]